MERYYTGEFSSFWRDGAVRRVLLLRGVLTTLEKCEAGLATGLLLFWPARRAMNDIGVGWSYFLRSKVIRRRPGLF